MASNENPHPLKETAMTSIITHILRNIRFVTNESGVTTDLDSNMMEPAFAVATDGTVTQIRQ